MSFDIPRATSLVHREAQVVAKYGRIPYYHLVVDHGQGALLYDVDGNEYLDFIASAASANVGHAHPHVVRAICEASKRFVHYSTAYMYHEAQADLAELLVERAPGRSEKLVSLGNSGSDANDGIMKIARAATGRPYIVSFMGAYHGSTYGSLSMSAISLNMRRKIGPLVPGCYHIPYPDVYRNSTLLNQMTNEQVAQYFMQPLHQMIQTCLPAEEIACIIVEPIAGDLGIVPAPHAFMQELASFCEHHGILLAVDEINQGMGRSGKLWSIEHYGIEPDLMSVAKSLASGMPLSAVVGKREYMESLEYPAHAFTTAGNPVCCAAALATFDVLDKEGLVERSAALGAYVEQRLARMQKDHPSIVSVHGKGLNLGVDICAPANHEPTAYMGAPSNEEAATRDALKMVQYCFTQGLVLTTLHGNTLRIQPPLVITEDELDRGLDIIEEACLLLEEGRLTDDLLPQSCGW